MTPALPASARPLTPSLPDWRMAARGLRRALRRRQGPGELYAIGVDPLWFALAVLLGLLLAGWLIVGLGTAPPAPGLPAHPVVIL